MFLSKYASYTIFKTTFSVFWILNTVLEDIHRQHLKEHELEKNIIAQDNSSEVCYTQTVPAKHFTLLKICCTHQTSNMHKSKRNNSKINIDENGKSHCKVYI